MLTITDDEWPTTPEAERQKFLGSWAVDGRKTVVFDRTSVQSTWLNGRYRLDPRAEPKILEVKSVAPGPSQEGIYRFEGDTLVLAFNLTREGRPRSFDDKADVSWRLTRMDCRAALSSEAWVDRSCGLPTAASVLAFAGSGNRIYAATGDGVYRTESQGESWERLGGGSPGDLPKTMYGAVGARGSLVLAGTTASGIYRSEDSGETWALSSSGLTEYGEGNYGPIVGFLLQQDVFWAAAAGNAVFAGGMKGIFRSEDAGRSWSAVAGLSQVMPGEYPEVRGLGSAGDDHLLAFNSQKVVFSPDAGKSWTLLMEGLPSECYREFDCLPRALAIEAGQTLFIVGNSFYRLQENRIWEDIGGGALVDFNDAVFLYRQVAYVGARGSVWVRELS